MLHDRALSSLGCYAVDCQISDAEIECGCLMVERDSFEDVSGRAIALYSIDDESTSYRVQLPRLTAYVTTRITLPICKSSP